MAKKKSMYEVGDIVETQTENGLVKGVVEKKLYAELNPPVWIYTIKGKLADGTPYMANSVREEDVVSSINKGFKPMKKSVAMKNVTKFKEQELDPIFKAHNEECKKMGLGTKDCNKLWEEKYKPMYEEKKAQFDKILKESWLAEGYKTTGTTEKHQTNMSMKDLDKAYKFKNSNLRFHGIKMDINGNPCFVLSTPNQRAFSMQVGYKYSFGLAKNAKDFFKSNVGEYENFKTAEDFEKYILNECRIMLGKKRKSSIFVYNFNDTKTLDDISSKEELDKMIAEANEKRQASGYVDTEFSVKDGERKFAWYKYSNKYQHSDYYTDYALICLERQKSHRGTYYVGIEVSIPNDPQKEDFTYQPHFEVERPSDLAHNGVKVQPDKRMLKIEKWLSKNQFSIIDDNKNNFDMKKQNKLQEIWAKEMKSEPVLETANGSVYIQPSKDGKNLEYGSVTNAGMAVEGTYEYDFDRSLDYNIQQVAEQIFEENGYPEDDNFSIKGGKSNFSAKEQKVVAFVRSKSRLNSSYYGNPRYEVDLGLKGGKTWYDCKTSSDGMLSYNNFQEGMLGEFTYHETAKGSVILDDFKTIPLFKKGDYIKTWGDKNWSKIKEVRNSRANIGGYASYVLENGKDVSEYEITEKRGVGGKKITPKDIMYNFSIFESLFNGGILMF